MGNWLYRTTRRLGGLACNRSNLSRYIYNYFLVAKWHTKACGCKVGISIRALVSVRKEVKRHPRLLYTACIPNWCMPLRASRPPLTASTRQRQRADEVLVGRDEGVCMGGRENNGQIWVLDLSTNRG